MTMSLNNKVQVVDGKVDVSSIKSQKTLKLDIASVAHAQHIHTAFWHSSILSYVDAMHACAGSTTSSSCPQR